MKDLLKRLLCIVLALTMVVALVACGSSEDEDEEEDEDIVEEKKSNKKNNKETEEETTEEPEEDENPLVGEWEATIDMSDYISDMMYAEMGVDMDIEDFAIVMTLEFDEDGTYKADLDMSPMEDAMDDFIDQLWDVMMEMSAEEYGMTVEEVEDAMEQSGVTKDALMEEIDMDALFEEMFEAFEDYTKGKWILDGDELYMDEKDPEDAEPAIIELDDDEFSIVDGEFMGEMDEDMMEYLFPIVFERV